MKRVALKPLLAFIFFFFDYFFAAAQTIATFSSVAPTAQTQSLVLPSTHTFQRIIKTGDPLSGGGNLGRLLDYTGYVPINGSSTSGYLSISSEDYPAECSILGITFNNGTKTWSVNSGNKVSFPVPDIGQVGAFCAGTITPKNTLMVCEEFNPALDDNSDGYQDLGWIIEIDPATHSVINQDATGGVDKLWALGREKHEDIAIKSDGTVAYWGADNSPTGFVYKFVPTVAGNFSRGLLYVLQTTDALGSGNWQLVANTTQGERNNTISLAQAAGGYNFNRIEGLEIGPDGKIYFAATTSGRIYRFSDAGTTATNLEVFVESTSYDVDGAGPMAPEPWGSGADNIAFDGEGNLWVLQDGGKNYIWVVGPQHTAANPAVRLFATIPEGGEPTGISFSPDYRYLFLSVQHPNITNTASQTDAAGTSVIFNTHTAIVIARKEFLGTDAVLPIRFLNFSAKKTAAGVALQWKVSDAIDHHFFSIKRSNDGIAFTSIGENKEVLDNFSGTFSFTDKDGPLSQTAFYRIKEIETNGSFYYSEVKEVQWNENANSLTLYPVPATKELTVIYRSTAATTANISILNNDGNIVSTLKKQLEKGSNLFRINVEKLSSGNYFLQVLEGNRKESKPFTKF